MHALRRRAERRTVRTWRAAACALFAIATIASGTSASMAASLPRPSSSGHGSGLEGTAAAKSRPGKQPTVLHAVPSQSTATGALSTISAQVVHGGYTSAGIGMRNLGYGKISITGVPAHATVKSATLLWDVLADQAEPAFAQGTINGKQVSGTEWASGASPCWPVNDNFSYEANVTKLVTGNGSYALAGFATGQSNGADPWLSGSAPPLLEGASLVVVYQLASMPLTAIQLDEGATETDSGNSAAATLGGFIASSPVSAATTYIVADGQRPGNTASFNGTVLPGVSFPGAAPQAVPHYSQGNLWDNVTANVSSEMSPGENSAKLAVTGYDDCLVWVGQVLAVSSGSVLALGDSIGAGYGLGPSNGFPRDNQDAYPAVLAKTLGGVPVQNYAVAGACASNTEPGCQRDSVNRQIKQVPRSFRPSLVTLTVGADDIRFNLCLKAIVEDSDISLTKPGDPCNPVRLAKDLATFRKHLAEDLQALSSEYPHAKILVMDYYNPLPQAPAATGSPCLVSDGLALLYEHAQEKSWLKVIEGVFLHHAAFISDARSLQGQAYADAQTVLGQLNGTINAAATGIATVVDTDFAGHDICAGSNAWVFNPIAAADLSLKIGSVSKTAHLSLGGEVCTDPLSAYDWNFKRSAHIHIRRLHVSASLDVSLRLNCSPHPNAKGQDAIANDFYQQSP